MRVSGRLLRVLWIAATWIGLQLLLDFSSGGNSLVAIWAHIGGFLAGLVLTPPCCARSPRGSLLPEIRA
ncbi:rhomboid family intramembrane serine protease [Hankyongella ginsenosidimutans]|uniref:rhomboid family intramembrane serine protease n=1 Tax=Hankyongella ginsenosidimutans TaxID=1763828 RepID=UPI001CA3508E|nr:rhomboid family intramembrane serine protease [Hankyongella ginsenosidimutans]